MSVRMVLDTTVLVAALRSAAGASRQLLVAALEKKFELLLSVPLMIEYESVLTRKEHLKAAGLKEAEVKELLDALAAVAEPVVPSFPCWSRSTSATSSRRLFGICESPLPARRFGN